MRVKLLTFIDKSPVYFCCKTDWNTEQVNNEAWSENVTETETSLVLYQYHCYALHLIAITVRSISYNHNIQVGFHSTLHPLRHVFKQILEYFLHHYIYQKWVFLFLMPNIGIVLYIWLCSNRNVDVTRSRFIGRSLYSAFGKILPKIQYLSCKQIV